MTFSLIFADDKRKAVLIRGLETPKKGRSDTRLSQKHISVEVKNAKSFWNAFISPTDLHKGIVSTVQIAQSSYALTRPSSRLV